MLFITMRSYVYFQFAQSFIFLNQFLKFVNFFVCIHWNDYVIFLFHSITMKNYTVRFLSA